MNLDILEGSFKLWQGRMRSQWGYFTHNDQDVTVGARMQRQGRMQKAYGEAREAADRQMRMFESSHRAWQTENV
jgi:uncharacterized protein YjbJ (UPF0337 family)